MPALPPVANVLKVAVHQSFEGTVPIVNTFHLRWTGAIDFTSTDIVAKKVHDSWAGNITAFQSNAITLLDAEVTDLTSPSGPQSRYSLPVVGGNAGIPLPAGTALVVSEGTIRRYRGGHPRMYIAGLLPGHLGINGLWLPAIAATIQAAFTVFKTEVELGIALTLFTNLEMVNVSYFEGFTNPVPAAGKRARSVASPRLVPLVDSITQLRVNPKPASQRRRNQQ